jgi:hypothetical protein
MAFPTNAITDIGGFFYVLALLFADLSPIFLDTTAHLSLPNGGNSMPGNGRDAIGAARSFWAFRLYGMCIWIWDKSGYVQRRNYNTDPITFCDLYYIGFLGFFPKRMSNTVGPGPKTGRGGHITTQCTVVRFLIYNGAKLWKNRKCVNMNQI